jgi:hypothetical protein
MLFKKMGRFKMTMRYDFLYISRPSYCSVISVWLCWQAAAIKHWLQAIKWNPVPSHSLNRVPTTEPHARTPKSRPPDVAACGSRCKQFIGRKMVA